MDQVPDRPFQIVVGFDFSDSAELALDQALALARRDGPAVVHVLGVLGHEPGNELSQQRRIRYEAAEKLQRRLEAVVHKRAGQVSANGRVFVHARIGTAAVEILRLAGETRADLIVVGTHGRRGLKRLALGSVAEEVTRKAACPVLVMRPSSYSDDHLLEGIPEAPCPHCVARRAETGGARWWCPVHAAPYVAPRRYEPTHGEMVELRDDAWALW